MRRAADAVGLGWLALTGISVALNVNAAQWDTLSDGRALVPEPLSQAPVRQELGPLLLPSEDGWWLLGNPGITDRRLIARFTGNQLTPEAATVVADSYRPDAAVLADGALAVMLHQDNDCFFDNDCDDIATLEVRNRDTSLRWSRRFKGPCSTPLSQQSELILACADQLLELDQDGRTLRTRPLAGGKATLPPRWASSPDSLLLVRQSSSQTALLDAFDVDLNPRWRREWPEPLRLIGNSASVVYFSERPEDDFQVTTRSLIGLQLIDGETAFEQPVSGRISSAVTSNDQVYLLASDEEDEQKLLLVSAAGQRSFAVNDAGGGFADLLAIPNGLIAAERVDGGVRLVTFFTSGVVTGIQQFPLPEGNRLQLTAIGPGSFALINWDHWVRYPTLELRSIYGEALSSRLAWVPVNSGTQGGVIDLEQRTSWIAGKVSTALGDFLARTAFDGTDPILTIGAATTDYVYRHLLGPSRVGDRYCVASAPSAVIPQPPNSGITDLLCARRDGGGGGERIALTLPGVWPNGIALGASSRGTPKILSSVVTTDLPLFVTEVEFDGTAVTRPGAVLAQRGQARLQPDLSGLIGSSVIDADGHERFQLPLGGDVVLASWQLSDAGWLVQTSPPPPNYGLNLSFVRVDADGQLLWQRTQSLPLGPRPAVAVAEHGDAIVVEYSPPLGPYDDQPGSGETGRRLWLDKASGELRRVEESLKDAQPGPLLLSLDPEQGAAGLWRLIGAGQGLLAQSLTAGSSPYWLDCAMSECAIEAHAAADGRALFKLSGNRAEGFHNQLVSVALDDLSLSAMAPGDPAASGRWHDPGSLYGGLLVTRNPLTRQPLRLWFGEVGSSDVGVPLGRWWSLKESGRVGAVIEHQINFVEAVQRPEHGGSAIANLQPLMNGELYLHQVFDRRILGELNAKQAKVSHHRLQSRAESAHTRTYFASDTQWIAIDPIGGEGIWGRPDGRWYRLREQSGERWIVSAEIRSSAIRGADQLPERREDLAIGQLRLGRCGGLQWRVLNALAGGDRQFNDAMNPVSYQSGDSCR